MQKITSWRNKIDKLNYKIIHLLAERFAITRELGEYKIKNKNKLSDAKREKIQLESIKKISTELGINPKLAKKIFTDIFAEVKKDYKKL